MKGIVKKDGKKGNGEKDRKRDWERLRKGGKSDG
jgi:hypothetical protein